MTWLLFDPSIDSSDQWYCTWVRNSSRVTVGVGANDDDADDDRSELPPPSDRMVAAADTEAAISAPLNSVSAGDADADEEEDIAPRPV